MMRRSLRTGWTANDTAPSVPRSQSSQTGSGFSVNSLQNRLSQSRSMHAQLRLTPCEPDDCSRPQLDEIERCVPSQLHVLSCVLTSCFRRDLMIRSAWIDRGSSVHLQSRAYGRKTAFDRCESQYTFQLEPLSDNMRRSYTTEELKKERRRLPKRPDVVPFTSECSRISL